MMKNLLPAAVALLVLSACDTAKKAPEEVTTTAPDPQAAEMAKRAPIELPPAVKADVTFRCKDNSLVYVSFFQGDKMAHLKTSKTGTPVTLKTETAGTAMTADGYSLSGTPNNITLTQPGKGTLTCKS